MNNFKCIFNSCLLRANISLVGINSPAHAENFNIVTETYLNLTVTLPPEVARSCKVKVGEEMVFIGKRKVWKWNVVTGDISSGALSVDFPFCPCCSNVPPVCTGNLVHFVLSNTGPGFVLSVPLNMPKSYATGEFFGFLCCRGFQAILHNCWVTIM